MTMTNENVQQYSKFSSSKLPPTPSVLLRPLPKWILVFSGVEHYRIFDSVVVHLLNELHPPLTTLIPARPRRAVFSVNYLIGFNEIDTSLRLWGMQNAMDCKASTPVHFPMQEHGLGLNC